jgi:hypothetical protein
MAFGDARPARWSRGPPWPLMPCNAMSALLDARSPLFEPIRPCVGPPVYRYRQPSSHWVLDDVPRGSQEIIFVSHRAVPRAGLPQRTFMTVFPCLSCAPGLPRVQESGDIEELRREKKMEMIRHQTCSEQLDARVTALLKHGLPDDPGNRGGKPRDRRMSRDREVESGVRSGVELGFQPYSLWETHRQNVTH